MMEGGTENGAGARQQESRAGTIIRLCAENFMCHSNLSIEFIDRVNFITGQNGSGKSAILTALCVAFGIKARGTQRASSLKDFIKNGSNHALVVVEMKNEGGDSFKPEVYGSKIIIERRITNNGNTFTMKDSEGRKAAAKRDELQELVEHFNIDVENPCVIMTQDKSREFLHSGSEKEKFKFFFRATLLQQVNDLLKGIDRNLDEAVAIVRELQDSLRPSLEELKALDGQIKYAEQVEEMSQQVGVLRKKLAWSWVYEVDEKIRNELQLVEKYQSRVPICQAKIDSAQAVVKEKHEAHTQKKAEIAAILEKTGHWRQLQEGLQKEVSQATKDKAQLEEQLKSKLRSLTEVKEQKVRLEQHMQEIRDKFVASTQAEESEREYNYRKIQDAIDDSSRDLRRLEEEEAQWEAHFNGLMEDHKSIKSEIEEKQARVRELQAYMRRLQNQQTNKVTAFGGDQVLRLLQSIEMQQHNFSRPPIGPIGAHVSLVGDGSWSLALEVAIGKLLNAFIVTSQRDMLQLRKCARDSKYGNLQIIIYDFERPLLCPPQNMLPDHALLTVMSVLQSEVPTILNVLIDQGSVERQVLVKDEVAGKHVAFERRFPNVKEVFTLDGTRMFARAGSQTTLFKDRNIRAGRLGTQVGDQISRAEIDLAELNGLIKTAESQKRVAEENISNARDQLQSSKRRRLELQRNVTAQEIHLRDLKASAHAESAMDTDLNLEELEQEIQSAESELQGKQLALEKFKIVLSGAQEKCKEAKARFDSLCDSAKDDIDALQKAERDMLSLEDELNAAISSLQHFEKIMNEKVFSSIKEAEADLEHLRKEREDNCRKASQICPEADVIELGGVSSTPQQLSTQFSRLQERVRREEREVLPVEELRRKHHKIERRVTKKEILYKSFQDKLEMLKAALDVRCRKFQRNVVYLRRQLTWQFNGHLRKKGFSGLVKVDYNLETLSLQLQMPQDTSNTAVRDTRALSGGERSFSTLAFALALHEMTEAPFRAMDEFDVFMDAVSRKISLETVVDFAVQQGSQWIFITPHDISLVRARPEVKKQQMAAPRP
ncbi:hypothetical protein O6H91_17G058500 [Diphasiastrum complanatum]|uniref:Uncharacterized protein n=1 Tax=Diphasiastrum complanatum TaxID=34168 RepID=A0ACC2B762_DIPCM|nr:hypothetical protein O6H91_17G058500 [Diphasiastrum complanatum]